MRLEGVLSAASAGLDSITRRLAVTSQNVANAGTADYVRQSVSVSSADAGGQGMGVRTGVATRNLDEALQASVLAAGGRAKHETTKQAVLETIGEASGTPGSGRDLASLVGTLRDAFSTLSADPSNATQQRDVVNKAGTLARGINDLAATISTARQQAQDGLGADVATANTALHALGTLTSRIRQSAAQGASTADLEDQRDVQMRTVSELTGARFLRQPDGDLLAVIGGALLPLDAANGPFAIGSATLAPDTPAAAVPALTLSGQPVSRLGGSIGARLELRDTVLPGLQSGLDRFAQSLASQFQATGLTLFTDATGSVPAAGTAGFAQAIQVASVVAAAPSRVRDGATGPGAAGDTTLIDAVLDTVLATGSGTLAGQASSLVTQHAALAADSAARADTDQAVQTTLQAKLSAGSGVSVDGEMTAMVQLQNAYGANAKVVAAIQAVWTDLLGMVR